MTQDLIEEIDTDRRTKARRRTRPSDQMKEVDAVIVERKGTGPEAKRPSMDQKKDCTQQAEELDKLDKLDKDWAFVTGQNDIRSTDWLSDSAATVHIEFSGIPNGTI